MRRFLARLGDYAARGKRFLAGLVGAVGGIAVMSPDLPGPWQRVVTGAVTVLAVLLGPAPRAPARKCEGRPFFLRPGTGPAPPRG